MRWLDKSYVKYWAWFFMPGHFIFYLWIGLGVWFALGVLDPEIERRKAAFVTGGFLSIVGLWFLLGTYHVMWIDIKKHFIPYRLSLLGDQVTVKGLYLKTDTFNRQAIRSLTTFEVYTHWYKRVHSLFIPHVEHYKLTLDDGRSYHFHGASTKVRAMLVELSGISDIKPGSE